MIAEDMGPPSEKQSDAGHQSTAASRGNELNMGGLPALLGYHLRCAQVAAFAHFKRSLGHLDLTPPQLGALMLIDANPGVSQSAVAEALRFDRSTLVQIIDRLEERGFVVRRVSARDRRSHALEITKDGAAFLRALEKDLAEHEQSVASRMTAAERDKLIDLLQRIHSPDGA